MADDLVGDLERLLGIETEDGLGGGDLVGAECRSVRGTGVHLGGGGEGDHGAQADDRRFVGDGLGRLDGRLDTGDVLTAVDGLHVPAIGLVPLGHILGQSDVGVVLDGDLVLVVEDDEVAELLGTGQRTRLGGDTLLDVAVGGDDVDEVVERAGPGGGLRIEQTTLVTRGHAHAHRRRQTLAQWPGGDLHALGVPVFGMTGGQRIPGAQCLQIRQFESETAEVQLDVQGQARMPAGQNETIPAHPLRVSGIVAHRALEQRVCQRGQTHRGARVPAAAFLHRIGGQQPGGVDGPGVDVGPVGRVVGDRQRTDLVGDNGGTVRGAGHDVVSPVMSGAATALDENGYEIRLRRTTG